MKKIFVYVLAALTIAACSKEDEAAVEGGGKLKVVLDAFRDGPQGDVEMRAGYDGVKSIWTSGDAIGVGIDANNANLQFTQVQGSLSQDLTTVQFEGELDQNVTGNVQSVGYYPYSPSATTVGQVVTTKFPDVQNYVAGGYTGVPLFGSYSGDISTMQMQFKNLFSVIKLTLTKDASLSGKTVKLQAVVFEGNSNETVSGTMSVDMSGSTPVVAYTGSGKTVTLNCGAGVELTSAPQTFYIAVPAINYATGYSLTFMTDQGQVTKSVKATGANYSVNTVYATPALAVKDLVTPFIIVDINLRNALQDLGLLNILNPLTGEVTITAAGLAVVTLDLSGKSIVSLAGIENFPALLSLNIANNNLVSVDLSKLPLLTSLNLSNNDLTSLDLSANTALLTLDLSMNGLTSLDLSANTLLTNLNLSVNGLTTLDLSKNMLLTDLNCSGNQIASLNLSTNLALLTLNVGANKLTSLDLHANILLTKASVYGNILNTLNISGLEALLNLELVSGTNSISALTILTIPVAATVKNLVSDGTKWTQFNCVNNTSIQTVSLKTNLVLTGGAVTGNTALTTLDVTASPLALLFTTSGNNILFHIVGPIL